LSVSIDNIIISWNNGSEKMFDYKATEIIGKSIYQIIPLELQSEQLEIFRKINSKGLLDYYETQRIRKDGKLIDVSLTVSPIFDDNGNLIATSKIMRNISNQKNIENEKIRIVNDLIQRNRDLEQFTNIISHNLRALVANIIGINNYIMRKNTSPLKKQLLDVALNKSVLNLDNVIRDLNLILQIRSDFYERKTVINFSDLV
jgi:PAS domain S-box-containing protein